MYQHKLEKDIRCPLEYGLQVFGGKWKSRIICVLAESGTLRYSMLRKSMGNITDAVLASTLKELMADSIVERKSYDEIPPRVEYRLTEKGKSVVPILQNICKWAGAYHREDSENTLIQCQNVTTTRGNYGNQIYRRKNFHAKAGRKSISLRRLGIGRISRKAF